MGTHIELQDLCLVVPHLSHSLVSESLDIVNVPELRGLDLQFLDPCALFVNLDLGVPLARGAACEKRCRTLAASNFCSSLPIMRKNFSTSSALASISLFFPAT